MPAIKYIFFFESAEGYGFTETHFRANPSSTVNLQQEIDTYAAKVIPARMTFAAEDITLESVRVSYPVANDIASLNAAVNVKGVQGQPSASEVDDVVIPIYNTLYTKKKILHARGIWKSVVNDERFAPGLDPTGTYASSISKYVKVLSQNSFGWESKDPTKSSTSFITGYVTNPDGTITFTLNAPGLPAATVGLNVQVRVSKLNHSRSPLNRQLIVHVTDATHCTTVTQFAAGPFVSQGRMGFRGLSLEPYANLGELSLGERRMGKPLNRLPGRSRAKAVY